MFSKSIKILMCSSLIFLAVILASCSTMIITYDKKPPKIQKNSNVIFLKNSFSEEYFTKNPLSIIEVTVYKNKLNENGERFREAEKKSADWVASLCTQTINQKMGKETIVINTPFSVNNFDVLDNITNNIESQIAAECKKANADYAFIPLMRMNVTSVEEILARSAKTLFESKVYVFNNNGKIIGKVYISSNAEWIYSIDSTSYQLLVRYTEPLYKQLLDQLF
jgi:hypothetical protein